MPTSFPGSSPSRSLEREREREGEDPGNEVGLMRKHWKQVNVDRWMQMNDHGDLVIVIKSHNALCLIVQ